jgi:hypothetical protein
VQLLKLGSARASVAAQQQQRKGNGGVEENFLGQFAGKLPKLNFSPPLTVLLAKSYLKIQTVQILLIS